MQSEWVLWVCRISDIVNIHKLLGPKGYKRNRMLFNELPRIVKTIERRASKIDSILPMMMMVEFERNIRYIKENIGRR